MDKSHLAELRPTLDPTALKGITPVPRLSERQAFMIHLSIATEGGKTSERVSSTNQVLPITAKDHHSAPSYKSHSEDQFFHSVLWFCFGFQVFEVSRG